MPIRLNCAPILLALLFATSACATPTSSNSLVVYTSVPQTYAEPVLKAFEEQTGIAVQAIYDSETANTTGLADRLIAEKNRPQADVFWNAEFVQTLRLKDEGVLAVYQSPGAQGIPYQYVDPEGYWTGFGGRARILLVNTDLLTPETYPNSIFNIFNEIYPADRIGIALPLSGTTATHAAALYAAIGPEEARSVFQALVDRGIQVVDDNSMVAAMVEDGRLLYGLTDTAEACTAIRKGAEVAIIVPDQGEEQMGALIIPNTVTLVAGAPHVDAARKLIDYLLSVEVEKKLIELGWSQVTLRPVDGSSDCLENINIRGMPVTLAEIYEQFTTVTQDMSEIFMP